MATNGIAGHPDQAVSIEDLHFRFSDSDPVDILAGIDLSLPAGSRCLLIGANGAGKSTLLQILAGKRLTRAKAKVLGHPVFFNTPPGVTYLGTEWAMNPVVRSDLGVAHFLDSVGGWRHKERRNALLDILDVDLGWRMHQISDGERRRVQIVQGLMAPWDLLLLDEVTVDLDVLVRSQLLAFLKRETEERNATILYATHIFDGLDSFPTHICHLRLGSTTTPTPIAWPFPVEEREVNDVPSSVRTKMTDPDRTGSRLLELALYWLQEDKRERDAEPTERYRRRGARREEETTDSEAFYKRYDYTSGR